MNSVAELSKRLRAYVDGHGILRSESSFKTDLTVAADTIDKMSVAIELCEMALREWDNPILADQARRAIADIGVKNAN